MVFAAVANELRSFVDASLVCALLELGAADKPSKTTNGNLRRRNLPEDAVSKSGLHRVSTRLASEGVLLASVYKNTRTTFSVSAEWLDRTLDAWEQLAAGSALPIGLPDELVSAMHQLRDYDAALMLARLRQVSPDQVPSMKLAELIEPIAALVDRHRARRAVYRLAERGLVTLAPKARSGLGITLVPHAIDALLAQRLPGVRYLRPDAFSSQPYFVARAARLATAVAADHSVELGVSVATASHVVPSAGCPAQVAPSEAVGDSALRS